MAFVFWSPPSQTPIKYMGMDKKNNQIAQLSYQVFHKTSHERSHADIIDYLSKTRGILELVTRFHSWSVMISSIIPYYIHELIGYVQ